MEGRPISAEVISILIPTPNDVLALEARGVGRKTGFRNGKDTTIKNEVGRITRAFIEDS